MLLPSSYFATLLLLVLTVVLWGSWANTQKLTGKWRFELYYFDFAIGVGVAAVLLGFTFGTLGYDGFSTMDDFLKAGKRQELFGFCAGVVFNLGLMLLSAAVSVASLSVVFSMGFGLAAVVGLVVEYVRDPVGSAALLFAGAGLALVAVVLAGLAYRTSALHHLETAAKLGVTRTTLKQVSMKGVILSACGGVLLGLLFPVSQMAAYRDLDNQAGLGPYALAIAIAAGVVSSTFVYSLFFMNLPVEGKPIVITDYFKGTPRQHFLGWLGGILFGCGLVAVLVAASAQAEARVGPPTSFGLAMLAGVVGAIWGLFYWDERKGAVDRARVMLQVMLVVLALGIGLMSFAPGVH